MSFRPTRTCLILLFFTAYVGAQDVSLSGFSLNSAGHLENGSYVPVFASAGSFSGRFVPADWIRLTAGISLYTDDTAYFLHPSPEKNKSGTVTFDGASVMAPRFLGGDLNFTAFTGTYDDAASGSLLRELLKVELASPEFLEMPAGSTFDPETWIEGTGLAMTTVPYNGNSVLGMYLYWNSMTGTDSQITGDIRLGMSGDLFRFNVFSGFSTETNQFGIYYRGGFSSVLVSPEGNELYAEAGLRTTEPGFSQLSRNLYFLFEPRLVWDHADLAFTFFSAPLTSDGVDSTFLGANILAGFGNLKRAGIRGGFSILGSIDPAQPSTLTPFSFSVSPFCTFKIRDLLLNMTLVINPLLLDDLETMGEIKVSLKAVL